MFRTFAKIGMTNRLLTTILDDENWYRITLPKINVKVDFCYLIPLCYLLQIGNTT